MIAKLLIKLDSWNLHVAVIVNCCKKIHACNKYVHIQITGRYFLCKIHVVIHEIHDCIMCIPPVLLNVHVLNEFKHYVRTILFVRICTFCKKWLSRCHATWAGPWLILQYPHMLQHLAKFLSVVLFAPVALAKAQGVRQKTKWHGFWLFRSLQDIFACDDVDLFGACPVRLDRLQSTCHCPYI